MRACTLGLFLTAAVLFPKSGNAQVFAFRTPPPTVSAAGADWQINSDPIVVAGVIYYPTHGFRMFDGQLMAQVGVFDRVPVYADTTLEAYSVIYVPIGGARMRGYERRREGELASTTGSRPPSFPVVVATERAPFEPQPGTSGAPAAVGGAGVRTDTAKVAASGRTESVAPGTVGTVGAPDRSRPRRSSIESIARPDAVNGVWLEFDGARWYADGPAAIFSPDRFEPVGDYRGFAVYRDRTSRRNEIWISVVKDGPVAPYSKR
jgi:hypothetical protein